MDLIMNTITSVLNYQPFGNWGEMSLFSVRIFHLIGIWFVLYFAVDFVKDVNK